MNVPFLGGYNFICLLTLVGIMHYDFQAVGLYPTNSLEMNKYILENSKANILVVENESMGKEILKYKQDLPLLTLYHGSFLMGALHMRYPII